MTSAGTAIGRTKSATPRAKYHKVTDQGGIGDLTLDITSQTSENTVTPRVAPLITCGSQPRKSHSMHSLAIRPKSSVMRTEGLTSNDLLPLCTALPFPPKHRRWRMTSMQVVSVVSVVLAVGKKTGTQATLRDSERLLVGPETPRLDLVWRFFTFKAPVKT